MTQINTAQIFKHNRGPVSGRPQLQSAPLRVSQEFPDALKASQLWPLRPTMIDTLQVNVGRLCNQTCRHCHVDAGPERREAMKRETFEHCMDAIGRFQINNVDITGGAPELNPHFRWFVEECRKLDVHVLDRCNLTIVMTNPHADLPEFLADHQVEVVCSLPHYRKLNTDAQRGAGIFDASITALRRFNEAGYANGNPDLSLVLVTNPAGAFLPGNQASLEHEWKRELERLYGIRFDRLYSITNMPIGRFLDYLVEKGTFESYLQKLIDAYNPTAAAGVMCRHLISVGWDGCLYDCDFNQMLEIGIDAQGPRYIRDFDRTALEAREIQVGRHCYGCTAGSGSSCGGATA